MKILIIGAGLLGVSSAYYLAKAGYKVEVIDRQPGPALETSYANAGMLTPSMADPWNAPGALASLISYIGRSDSPFLLRPKALPSLIGWGATFLKNSQEDNFLNNFHLNIELAKYSLCAMRELRNELNIEYGKNLMGTIKVFRDDKSMEKVVKLANNLKDHNVDYQIIAKEELVKFDPALSPIADKLSGGIYFKGDEFGDAHKFTKEVTRISQQYGAIFRFGVTVEKIVSTGSQIHNVITSEGEVFADKYIVCAGSYSPLLAKKVGLDIPIRPVKGYSLTIPLNGWNQGPKIPIIDDGLHAAISPFENFIRVAGTAEFAGYDNSHNKKRFANLYNLLREILPDFTPFIDKNEVSEWSGLRPMSADGVPLIGKTKLDNLFLNTGHGHLGWTMAAGSAKMLCDLICCKESKLDPTPYSINRF